MALSLSDLAYSKIDVMTREVSLTEVPRDFRGANNSICLLIFLGPGSFSECSLFLETRRAARNCKTGGNKNNSARAGTAPYALTK